MQVTCRVETCKKSIVKQNYRFHLRDKHPEENENDLREASQPRLQWGLKVQPAAPAERAGEDGEIGRRRQDRSRSPLPFRNQSCYPKMLDTVDFNNCPCSPCLAETACWWPTYHTDIREVMSKGEYRKIPMGQLVQDPSRTRAGREQAGEVLLLDRSKIIQKTNSRAKFVVDFLHTGLDEKVYNAEDKIVINHTRTLTDLKTTAIKVSSFGAAQTASLGWRKFLEAGKFFEQDLVCRMGVDEIRIQFRELYRRVEATFKGEDISKLSSLDILGRFLSSKGELSKDIEGVLSIIARAAVCTSVESIVESWVSQVEHHSPAGRVLSQDRLEDEAMVAINGPQLVHADEVIKGAMRAQWADSKNRNNVDGHFIRRSSNIRSYAVSRAVDRIVKKPAKLRFMGT